MFLQYSDEILKSAEQVLPGRGLELVQALDTVAGAAFVAGVAVGFSLAWMVRAAFVRLIQSKRYRDWRAVREGGCYAD